jgi:hypothetical protein
VAMKRDPGITGRRLGAVRGIAPRAEWRRR